jgi:mannose-6-phosphate isomerase-like protein (cupin superfamily)
MLVRSIYSVKNTPAYNGTVDQWRLYQEGELLSTINGINANIIAPGTGSLSHQHEHTEHIYFILGGKGIVKVGDEEQEVNEGDAIYMPPRLAHSIRNTGTYPLRFLAITADEKPGK